MSLGGATPRRIRFVLATASGVYVFVARRTDDQCTRQPLARARARGRDGWRSGAPITSEPAVAANSGAGIARGRCAAATTPWYPTAVALGASGFVAAGRRRHRQPVVCADDGGCSVFMRGADGAICYRRIPNAGAPRPWVSLGGGAVVRPGSPCVDGAGTPRGRARQRQHGSGTARSTTDWVSLGGGASADPVVVADAGGGDTQRASPGATTRITIARRSRGGGWQSLVGSSAPVRAGVVMRAGASAATTRRRRAVARGRVASVACLGRPDRGDGTPGPPVHHRATSNPPSTPPTARSRSLRPAAPVDGRIAVDRPERHHRTRPLA